MLRRNVALVCLLAGLVPAGPLAAPASGAPQPAPGAPAVAALAGSWANGTVSLLTYQNAMTGEFAPASGAGEIFTVSAGAHYVWVIMDQVSLYNCTSLTASESEGTLAADGPASC